MTMHFRKSGSWRASLLALAAVSMTVSPSVVAQAQTARAQNASSYRIDPARLAGLPDFIDGVMAQQIDGSEVAGAVVSVVYRGKLLFSRGYGFQDVDKNIPADPERSVFRPASTSKLFTWTALMQMVEQGKVGLDDDVNKYLAFKIPPYEGKPILVRHLLTHSTGFSDKGGGIATSPAQFEEIGAFIAKNIPDRVRAPGVEISYSNHATVLAGHIVERVSGESFFDYTDRHIFKPLGMNRSTFNEPPPAHMAQDGAIGYRIVDGRFVKQPIIYGHNIAPAGAAAVTANDMAKFMIAHLNGGRYGNFQMLKPATVRLMQTNQFANVPDFPGFALGFYAVRDHGPRLIGHGGNISDYHTMLLLAPEVDFGIFVSLTGGQGSDAGRTELINAVIGRLFPEKPSPRYTGPVSLPPAGAYLANRRDYSQKPRFGSYMQVKADGERGLVIEKDRKKTYWVQIGPRTYEKVTGARAGGPYEKVIFYGTAEDTKLSFSSEPMMLYRLDRNPPAAPPATAAPTPGRP